MLPWGPFRRVGQPNALLRSADGLWYDDEHLGSGRSVPRDEEVRTFYAYNNGYSYRVSPAGLQIRNPWGTVISQEYW